MNLDINIVIKVYRDEIDRLISENLLLKAQIEQLKQDSEKEGDDICMEK